MPNPLTSLAIAAAILLGSATATARAQDAPRQDDEILVEGVRIDDHRPVVDVVNAIPQQAAMRQLAERASLFERCAKRFDVTLARKVIDGPPNSATTRSALDRLIRTNVACYPTRAYMFEPAEPAYGDCNPAPVGEHLVCQVLFYRGAVLENAIRAYAPGLKLDRTDTSNPIVRNRFDWRERERGRYRVAADRRYFNVAACMVQREPALASRLMNAAPDERLKLQQVLIDRTRGCIGNARRVTVDPTQFRIYITDAVYQWAVAARNVDSLLPKG